MSLSKSSVFFNSFRLRFILIISFLSFARASCSQLFNCSVVRSVTEESAHQQVAKSRERAPKPNPDCCYFGADTQFTRLQASNSEVATRSVLSLSKSWNFTVERVEVVRVNGWSKNVCYSCRPRRLRRPSGVVYWALYFYEKNWLFNFWCSRLKYSDNYYHCNSPDKYLMAFHSLVTSTVLVHVFALSGLDVLDSEDFRACNVTKRLVHHTVSSRPGEPLEYRDEWSV